MNNSAIQVQNIVKKFDDKVAVNNISFEVEKGTIFSLLGTNGAGKTTTIHMLIGLLEPTYGQIDILGFHPIKNKNQLKKSIGVQLQSGALFKQLTVKELITLYAGFYKNPLNIDTTIKMVNLEEKANKRVHTLSGGQLQRLEISLALVTNTDILFLDEPTTGLDPVNRRKLWDTLLKFKALGKTIFLTTHFMDEAEILSDKVIIIDNGRIVAEGSPKALMTEHFGKNIIIFERADFSKTELEQIKSFSSVSSITVSNKSVFIYTHDYSVTLKELLEYVKSIDKDLVGLEMRKPNLEDLFLKLTRKEFQHESI